MGFFGVHGHPSPATGSPAQQSRVQRKAELVIVWCAWMAARGAPIKDEHGLEFYVAMLASEPTQAYRGSTLMMEGAAHLRESECDSPPPVDTEPLQQANPARL